MSPVELYQNNERLVHKLAWRFNTLFGYDQEELASYGKELILTRGHRFDTSKGQPTTFVYHMLNNAFQDKIRKERRDPQIGDTPFDIPAMDVNNEFVEELRHRISGRSRYIIKMLLSEKIGSKMVGKTPAKILSTLRKELVSRGWESVTVTRFFKEITECIDQIDQM